MFNLVKPDKLFGSVTFQYKRRFSAYPLILMHEVVFCFTFSTLLKIASAETTGVCNTLLVKAYTSAIRRRGKIKAYVMGDRNLNSKLNLTDI